MSAFLIELEFHVLSSEIAAVILMLDQHNTFICDESVSMISLKH